MKDNKIRTARLLAVLLSGAFVALLNETLLNVAMNALMAELHISAGKAQWLTSSYMLVIGIVIPVSAYLVERFTTRQLFFCAMLLFIAGTTIAAASMGFTMLLSGRILQALGTALLVPLVTNIVLVVIPASRRGAAMGTVALVTMFAPAAGPALSGLIVEQLSWRWLFYIVLPVAALSLLLGIAVLKNVTEPSKPRIDLLSFVWSTLGFGGIVYGFSRLGEAESGSSRTLMLAIMACGIVGLALFIIRQRRLETPMIDMGLFRYPMFALSLAIMSVTLIAMFAMMLVLPMYMQRSLLFSAVLTGLVMLPGGFVNGIASPVMGWIFDKKGPRVLLIPGIGFLMLTFYLLRHVGTGTAPGYIVLLHCLLMLSVAMIMMAVQTNGLNQLPAHLYPHGTAVMSTVSQVSGAVGTALFVAVMEHGTEKALRGNADPTEQESAAAFEAGVQLAFLAGLLFAAAALLLALFVRRSPLIQQRPEMEA